jgi:phosphonopyruvate decarboxylase
VHTSSTPRMSDTALSETVRTFLPPDQFYSLLASKGIDFYTGVPDSLLKDFCGYVTDTAPASNHIIAANEGNAIAIASGYHLATRKYPVVYMQNSGFGNCVNPLLSMTDSRVYGIPMLMLIGWRGEPGKKDEPQHTVQGQVMTSLLTDVNIPYEVLPDYADGAHQAVDQALHYMQRRSGPYALLVKRQTFSPYALQSAESNTYPMSREGALKGILQALDPFDILVGTTGFTSRELFELREQRKEDHSAEFLTVGSMGHASSIALGISVAKQSRQVFCIDGDGAALMHMGTMGTVGANAKPANYNHVLINNGAHDSVGGQPTCGFDVDFPAIATACGYKYVDRVDKPEDVEAAIGRLRAAEGPKFLEIRTNRGARKDLGRPTTTPKENKTAFMSFLDA